MREIKRGDIFFADLNQIRGSEQGGIRPVLVVSNDTGNKYSPTIIIAPITSNIQKAKLPTHVEISNKGLSKSSIALFEQIRTIDKSRLSEYIGTLDSETMKQVDMALEISIALRNNK